jgi:hypothetical protein
LAAVLLVPDDAAPSAVNRSSRKVCSAVRTSLGELAVLLEVVDDEAAAVGVVVDVLVVVLAGVVVDVAALGVEVVVVAVGLVVALVAPVLRL